MSDLYRFLIEFVKMSLLADLLESILKAERPYWQMISLFGRIYKELNCFYFYFRGWELLRVKLLIDLLFGILIS